MHECFDNVALRRFLWFWYCRRSHNHFWNAFVWNIQITIARN